MGAQRLRRRNGLSVTIMKLCQFAKSQGKSCDNGYSKLILCEKDNVIRCLNACSSSCVSYLPFEEVSGRTSPGRFLSSQTSASRARIFSSTLTSADRTGGTHGCCGGNGEVKIGIGQFFHAPILALPLNCACPFLALTMAKKN